MVNGGRLMKKIYKIMFVILISCFCYFLLFSKSEYLYETHESQIKEDITIDTLPPDVQSFIAQELRKPVDEIRKEDLLEIKFLHIPAEDGEYELEELLKLFPNVQKLSVSFLYHSPSSLKYLEKLENLKQLRIEDLRDGNIDRKLLNNIEFFGLYHSNVKKDLLNLPKNITSLSMVGTNINDITLLANNHSLFFLDLANNNIESISALQNVKNLRGLRLSTNKIADLSALNKLERLENLEINNNNIVNIDVFTQKTFPKLTSLSLEGNYIADISPLTGREFYYLNLSNNNITNLVSFKHIDVLRIANNNITDFSLLKGIELISLDISNNPVHSLHFLSRKSKIKSLNIANTNISNLAALQNALYLEELNISNTPITTVNGLLSLKNLKRVVIHENQFSQNELNRLPDHFSISTVKRD
jgi:Leucine-rich repeat (LRR) protein